MIPATIIDDFFESPTLLRNYALSCEFPHKGIYPGVRTACLKDINPELYQQITSKIMSVFFDLSKDRVDWDFDIRFQLAPEEYKEGWAHTDGDVANFAGVVYLNQNAPLNGGTSLCYPSVPSNWRDETYTIQTMMYRDKLYSGEIDNADEKRIEHNNQFYTTLEVQNIFNRAFIYDGNKWHKENKLFGSGKGSRLTLVFFANILTFNQTKTPLQRWKTISSY